MVTNFVSFYACEITTYSSIYIIYYIKIILFYAITDSTPTMGWESNAWNSPNSR